MASDIFIPGDDLDAARAALDFVKDQIDIGNTAFDFDAIFGRELSRGSAQNFENRWEDGKFQLVREINAIRDKLQQVSDAFAQTDNDAAASLVNE